MTPLLEPQSSPFISSKLSRGTLRQQLLKTILPTALIPLMVAGLMEWQITSRRSIETTGERTWNQAMLTADVADSIAGKTGLEGKQEQVYMVAEHSNLSPSTQIHIIDARSSKVMASMDFKGVVEASTIKLDPDIFSKITALFEELNATKPPSDHLIEPGRKPLYVAQRPHLSGLVIRPFIHEEGFFALATNFNWKDKYYQIATVPGRNWVSVTTVNLSEVYGDAQSSASIFLFLILILGGVATAIAFIMARKLSLPITSITATVQSAAAGDLNALAKPQGSLETQVLGQSFNTLISQVRQLLVKQIAETERSQGLRDLSLQMSQATQAIAVQRYTVETVRQSLKTDRVLVFQFDPNWKGTIIAESIQSGWKSAQGMQIEDPCFAKGYVTQYLEGRISAIADIYSADLTECHLQQLAALSVRANLVAPVLVGGQLAALLIAHECEGVREWDQPDIDFFVQAASQLGLNLERMSLLERTQRLAQEQTDQRQNIQMGLLDLLGSVESAAQGDLTVRAGVDGEVGTVGDFFNSIISSLQTIVAQVKTSAEQVTVSVNDNEVAIRQLANEAEQQAQELGTTLHSIDRMTESIHTVAANAQEAAEVARSASSAAEVSSSAMDRAVTTIQGLRETVADTSLKVQRLGESSKQISKVVELINQFALETNMLAINAGIEAARAGEEGRGFAVVAQEVGTLAAQSAGATKEIERIVSSIQRETNALVQAMQSGKIQVDEGTQLIEETKQSLGQIVDVSQQIDQLVQAISTATVEQVNTSESVSEMMQKLTKVSERTSEASRSVSNALQGTVAITQQLQASVRTFKVTNEG